MTKFIGAGILPYAINDKEKLVFLLGKENDGTDKKRNNLYSDFGGGKEGGERPIHTAYREFVEETMNAIGNNTEIKKALRNPTLLHIANNGYYQYLIEIPYDDMIVNTFNRVMDEISRCMVDKKYRGHTHRSISSCPVGLVEKIKFKWFKPSEIIKNKRMMRPDFYKTFVDILSSHNII